MDDIECALSPENLHCDGEASSEEANRKYRYLIKLKQELEQQLWPKTYGNDNQ